MSRFEGNFYILLCKNAAVVLSVALGGLAYSGVAANNDRTSAGVDQKTARLTPRAVPVVASTEPPPIKIMSAKGGVTISKPAPVAVAAVAPVAKYQEGPEGPRPTETLFTQLGCKACHGAGAMYSAKMIDARPKEEDFLTSWILNPQKIKPGVQMPPFEAMMSENEARAMAKWIKDGNPK